YYVPGIAARLDIIACQRLLHEVSARREIVEAVTAVGGRRRRSEECAAGVRSLIQVDRGAAQPRIIGGKTVARDVVVLGTRDSAELWCGLHVSEANARVIRSGGGNRKRSPQVACWEG